MTTSRRPKPQTLRTLDGFPSPPDYERAPELGVLAILVSILDVTYVALLAANRDLLDDERPYWSPLSPTARPADAILRQIDRLHRAIATYQQAALPAPPQPAPDDIPF